MLFSRVTWKGTWKEEIVLKKIFPKRFFINDTIETKAGVNVERIWEKRYPARFDFNYARKQ